MPASESTAAILRPTFARWTVALIVCVTLIKMVYLIFLSPYELVADEAQYWDWSRHFQWTYYTKGPGIAWLIWLTTRILGHDEWAIRLPAVLCSAGTAWIIAAWSATFSRNCSSGFYAAVLVLSIPAYIATSLLMTIDPPYLLCWALAAWLGWRIIQQWSHRPSPLHLWALLGIVLALGFLFKFTILLLALGIGIFLVRYRRQLHWNASTSFGLMLCLLIMLIGCSPVILWNLWHSGATVGHLLDHLHGQSNATSIPTNSWSWTPMWFITYVFSQLALLGPVTLLIILAILKPPARKSRSDTDATSASMNSTDAPVIHDEHVMQRDYLLCCAGPVLVMYLAISLFTDAEGNWPIAGYLTLLVLTAHYLTHELQCYHQLLQDWQTQSPRPWRGYVRRQPETPAQIAFHWQIGFGILITLGLFTLPWLDKIPWLDPYIPLHRIIGARAYAAQVQTIIDEETVRTGQPPMVMTHYYDRTALLAYYLPGRPTVYCASGIAGGRISAYDFMPDTRLDFLSSLVNRPLSPSVVLIGSTADWWSQLELLNTPVSKVTIIDIELKWSPPADSTNKYAEPVFVGDFHYVSTRTSQHPH